MEITVQKMLGWSGRPTSNDWKSAIADWHDEAQQILDLAKAESRDMTAEEEAAVDACTKQMEEAHPLLEKAVQREQNRKAFAMLHIGQSLTGGRQNGPMFRTADGGIVRALLANESFQRPQPMPNGEPTPRIGDVLQSMLTGRYENASMGQVMAAIGSSDSSGGYILNPTLSGQVVDLARSASVRLRAGAVTLPMDSAELNIARLTGDPTGVWRPEGVAVTSSDVTFDRVTLRPRTLAAIVPVSIELLEDASNAGQIIEQALMAKLGLTLDQAILRGTGAESEPLGIKNHPTVGTTTSVGTPDDYQELTTAIGAIYSANYPGEPSALSWVMNPREAKKYDSLEDSTGQPLQPTPWAAAVKRLMTTSLSITEGGGAESSMIVGDFSQCVIGLRTSGVVIRVAQDGSVSDGTNTINATSQLMRLVVAYLRADVALLRPTWFNVLSGVTAS